MVAGVNSPVRSFKSVESQPLVMKYGRQSKIFDYDNNSYTDYCLSWGALILGHAHPNIVLAAKKASEKGISFGTTTREEIEIAEHICTHVPSMELIRFVNSGTEATMSAIRLARGFTKRELVVKFDGCYHGHVDDLLTKAGSGVAELKSSSSLGIPQSHINNTISLPYNDVEILEKTLTQHKDKIACVIIEPVAGNMGVIPANKDFLQALRALTKKYESVLIFDEIITGFRSSEHCLQGELGIYPDLTCLGKIIGGGFPVGAYGGRKDIMSCLAPLGGVYQAGTFAGNPVVMKAGLAALRLLNKSFYQNLNSRCEQFAESINAFLKENKINAHLSAYKSMMSLRFQKDPIENYPQAQAAASDKQYAKFFQHMLKQNIYMPPADLETFFVSGVHTQKDIRDLEKAIKTFFHPQKIVK
jgi:glutamate-1-semialdehyde 2,1-aminomutase